MNRVYGVIGNPINHSLSPAMHQFWYNQKGWNHRYHAFHVTDDLKGAVNGIKALGISGVNVTIPHKVDIVPFLDAVDEDAQLLGAVNTVVNKDGMLIGYNTDGIGFWQSIKEVVGDNLNIDKVLIIGAGGSARAVGLILAKNIGVQVDYANRTVAKAKELQKLAATFTVSTAMSLEKASKQLDQYDLIVNATPMGMGDKKDKIPLALQGVKQGTLCVDLIYQPAKTLWLQQAEHLGCRIMNGLPMLVCQGAKAFERWLGVYPDAKGAIDYLNKQLED